MLFGSFHNFKVFKIFLFVIIHIFMIVMLTCIQYCRSMTNFLTMVIAWLGLTERMGRGGYGHARMCAPSVSFPRVFHLYLREWEEGGPYNDYIGRGPLFLLPFNLALPPPPLHVSLLRLHRKKKSQGEVRTVDIAEDGWRGLSIEEGRVASKSPQSPH
jgi:hypothetical protein